MAPRRNRAPEAPRIATFDPARAAAVPAGPPQEFLDAVARSAAGPAQPDFEPGPDAPPQFREMLTAVRAQQSGAGADDTYSYEEDPETRRLRERLRAESEADAAAAARERRLVIDTIKSIFANYGLSSLSNKIVEYAQSGYSSEAIQIMLRETPEYQARFPAMKALSSRGRAISEAEYVEYETTAAQLERRYGLPTGMVSGNITRLLENDISATELNDRIMLASAAAVQAPQELKATFRDFYGIDEGGLAAYFLDPAVAAPILEKQAATAIIGAEGRMQGLGVERQTAEQLQALGVSQAEARQGFGDVAGAQGLTAGRGETVSTTELIQGTLAQNEEARRKRERVAGSRVAQFAGGGEFAQTREGTVGLGTAQT